MRLLAIALSCLFSATAMAGTVSIPGSGGGALDALILTCSEGEIIKVASGVAACGADSTGSGSLGSGLASTTNDITASGSAILFAGATESLLLTFTANTATFSSGTGVVTTAFPGTVSATTFVGALTGNSSTATALAANGADCATATHFAVGVDASGVAVCEAIGDADIPDNTTVTGWALGTIASGVGTALTALNGENIQDDTIDDDSIDFTDVTGVDLTLTDAGAITASAKITANASLDVANGATSSGVLKILEDTDAGTNFASFQVPALAADTVYILPADDGDSGQVLSTNGTGTLDWIANGAGSFDSTTVDATTWSDNANASNAWTFDVSGTDTVMTFGSGTLDYTGTMTATSFTSDASASPTFTFNDSDSASESSDATIVAAATDVGAGTEDVDVTISTQVNSTLTARITIDADGNTTIPSLDVGSTGIVYSTGTLSSTDLEVLDDGLIESAEITDGTITPTDMDLTVQTYDFSGATFRAYTEILAKTESGSPHTLVANECKATLITNTGAAGAAVYNLPAAVAGMTVTIAVAAAFDIDVNADTGDQILVLTNATADAISSDATVGSIITLVALDGTNWFPVGYRGTWTDVN